MDQIDKPQLTASSCRNKLLRAIPSGDFDRLHSVLQPVQLKAGRILHHAHVPVSHFYFIERGLVSIEAEVEHHKWTEVWQVGYEGCLGLPLIVGRECPSYRRVALVDGRALRIARHDFLTKLGEIASLRSVLLQYLFVVLLQTSRLNACNLRHSVTQRMARWLLLACDRYGDVELPITQSVLARVLGIRRAGVSNCLSELEREGWLHKERGTITVIDRLGLERASCACYGLIRKEVVRPVDGLKPQAGLDRWVTGRSAEPLLGSVLHAAERD
jgi:CRP-like cAMP-binding protein